MGNRAKCNLFATYSYMLIQITTSVLKYMLFRTSVRSSMHIFDHFFFLLFVIRSY
uniref:Uncharacterized protein n=1 Tax=Arundo donax TaxID=35708 RepID=A0A0A8YRL7_ARUDO